MALGTVIPIVGAAVLAFLIYVVMFIGRREKGLPPGMCLSIEFASGKNIVNMFIVESKTDCKGQAHQQYQ